MTPKPGKSRTALWRAKHPERAKAAAKKYRESERGRASMAKWLAAHPRDRSERGKRLNRFYNYGLTRESWLSMLQTQDFKCAICEKPIDDSAHADHDHKTGKVRGALCTNCNTGLGHFKDSPELLAKAQRYLTVSLVSASAQCAFKAG